MEQSVRRPLHPLVAVAAIAVILFCAAGIAAIAGWIPTSRSNPQAITPESGAVTPAPAAPTRSTSASAQPAPRAQPALPMAPAAPPASVQASTPVQATAPSPSIAPAVCPDCGIVVSVREVKQSGQGSGLGAVAGGVAGAVLGNQVGGGRGRDIATVVGAVGGAVAGHQVEKHVKSSVVYQIAVEMDDGSSRTFTESERPTWRPGDKVRVEGDRLSARG